jgi:hypothetical protein
MLSSIVQRNRPLVGQGFAASSTGAPAFRQSPIAAPPEGEHSVYWIVCEGSLSFLAHPVLSNAFVEVKQSVRASKRVRTALSLFQQHVSNGDGRRRVTISHWYRDLCQYLTASVGQML